MASSTRWGMMKGSAMTDKTKSAKDAHKDGPVGKPAKAPKPNTSKGHGKPPVMQRGKGMKGAGSVKGPMAPDAKSKMIASMKASIGAMGKYR